MPSILEERAKKYRDAIDAGANKTEASQIVYPDVNQGMVSQTTDAIIPLVNVPDSSINNSEISADISSEPMAKRMSVFTGIPIGNTRRAVSEFINGIPDGGTVVNYDRFDMASTIRNDRTAALFTELLSGTKGAKDDFDALLATAQLVFGSGQQGLFGVIAGESIKSIVSRLWPSASIGDSEGERERKALVPMSIKASILSTVGHLTALSNYGFPTPAGSEMIKKSREIGQTLINTDLHDGIISGMDLEEYIMANLSRAVPNDNTLFGYNIPIFKPIPDVGTPERAAYDQKVIEYADQNYAFLSSAPGGKLTMGGWAIGGALIDVFADPLMWTSDAPVNAVNKARELLPKSSIARTVGAIADKSRRIEDLINAKNKAETWADGALVDYKSNPTQQNMNKLTHARKFYAKSNERLMSSSNPGETINMSVLPRIRPEHIEPVGEVYLNAPPVTRAAMTRQFIADNVKRLRKEVEIQKKIVDRFSVENPVPGLFTSGQLNESPEKAQTAINKIESEISGWRDTGKFLRSRLNIEEKAGADVVRTGAFFKEEISKQKPYSSKSIGSSETSDRSDVLRSIHDNINRGLEQGAPHNEITQWQQTFHEVSNGPSVLSDPVIRSTMSPEEIIKSSLTEGRVAAVSADPTPIFDYGTGSPQQAQIRAMLGPDDSEAAGEAARILAAGGEIDDVAYYGLPLGMYNSSYGLRLRPHSGTELRALSSSVESLENELKIGAEWTGTDPVRNTVEAAKWQQTMGEKMGDFWAKALHPRSWNLRASGSLNSIREPMRVLQSVSPRTYTRIVNATHSQEFELTRMNEIFGRELRVLGVHKEVGGVNTVDKVKTEFFHDIMDMDTSTPEYIEQLASLNQAQQRSIGVLRQELDFLGDKLGLARSDRTITGFIHHVVDGDLFKNGARPHLFDGLGANSSILTPFMQTRAGGKGYVRDLSASLDVYGRAAARKLHIEPLLEDLEFQANNVRAGDPKNSWVADYLDDIINNQKGKASSLGSHVDRTMSSLNARMKALTVLDKGAKTAGQAMGKAGPVISALGENIAKLPGAKKMGGDLYALGLRTTDRGTQMAVDGLPIYNRGSASRSAMGVMSLTYSSILGGKPTYFPMAVSTGIATTGARAGMFETAKAFLVMGTPEGRRMAKAAGLDKQWPQILGDGAYTKLGRLASEMPSINGATMVGPSISATENMIRGWTFHAALSDLMRKQGFRDFSEVVNAGLGNQYFHEATRITEEVNHLFGLSGKPAGWQRLSKSGTSATTQFLSFIPKQTEELLSQTMRNPGNIGRYMMISGYLQRVAAKTGSDISSYVGLGFLPKSPDEATSVVVDTGVSLLHAASMSGSMLTEYADGPATERAWSNFARNANNVIPFAMATHTVQKGYETLRTGAVFSGGIKKYDADLGRFKWDPNKGFMENYFNIPKGLMSADGEDIHPTEMTAIMMGMKSVRGKLEQSQYAGRISTASRRIMQKRDIARTLKESVVTGDHVLFDKTYRNAIESGMIGSDISKSLTRSELELMVPRLMLDEINSTQKMLDAMIEDQRKRSLYFMRFGK